MKRLKHFVLRVVILCLIMAQVAASPAALALESDDAPAAEQPAMELFPVDDPVPIILLYVPIYTGTRLMLSLRHTSTSWWRIQRQGI